MRDGVVWTKPLCILIISCVTAAAGVVAERVVDDEPVLRLRLVDQTPMQVRAVKLRHRFEGKNRKIVVL